MDILGQYRRITRWPAGHWLFARAVCFKAPYFAGIAPRIDSLEPGRCVVSFRHRRAVSNHLGTVHAIALCNAAELAAGLAMDAALPRTLRWIPKGMQVDYLRKATGRMTAVATVGDVAADAAAREVPAEVVVTDPRGEAVLRATVSMWVSPRPAR
jgi:acyl-coenzyme A thioesterase PaaI-like protein